MLVMLPAHLLALPRLMAVSLQSHSSSLNLFTKSFVYFAHFAPMSREIIYEAALISMTWHRYEMTFVTGVLLVTRT